MRGGVGDISTGYDLEGQRIESLSERGFTYPSTPALSPNQTPIKGPPGHSREQNNQVVVLTTHSHPASSLKKEYSYISTPALRFFGSLYGDI